MAGERDRRPSEFGGRPGLIQSRVQPPHKGRPVAGHEPDEAERALMMRQIEPSPYWDDDAKLAVDELPPDLDTGTRLA